MLTISGERPPCRQNSGITEDSLVPQAYCNAVEPAPSVQPNIGDSQECGPYVCMVYTSKKREGELVILHPSEGFPEGA